MRCNTLQHTATHCCTLQRTAAHCGTLQYTAAHYNTLQHTATHCITLQHTAIHLRPFACLVVGWRLCQALQHTATHCNTPAPGRLSGGRLASLSCSQPDLRVRLTEQAVDTGDRHEYSVADYIIFLKRSSFLRRSTFLKNLGIKNLGIKNLGRLTR